MKKKIIVEMVNSLNGAILTKTGDYDYVEHNISDEEKHYYFEKIEDAKEFITIHKKDKINITYYVFDDSGGILYEESSEFKPIEFPKKEKKWWQFWK